MSIYFVGKGNRRNVVSFGTMIIEKTLWIISIEVVADPVKSYNYEIDSFVDDI